ncbi:MAG: hypothetical protein LBR06_03975 [Bacteroidales bacterium]|nr:hypothetical protein [Bacteroidales bacterium]
MRKVNICTVVLFAIMSPLLATTALGQEVAEFEPSGKVIARSFFDFAQGLGNINDETGFAITRAFLGYSYLFSPAWSATLIIDGASGNTAGKIEPHIRNAFINYNNNGLDVSIGMTGLYQFAEQEKFWGHRYVAMTLQDLNKMGHSTDLGVTVAYRFGNFLAADMSVCNGEGYKTVVRNNSTRYAAGMSVTPVNSLLFRIYADVYTESEAMRDEAIAADYTAQKLLSLFAGYRNEWISGGVEAAKLFDKGFVAGKTVYGVSTFVSGKVAAKWRLFWRYDRLKSANPEGWHGYDGHLSIAGAEFQPFMQMKIAPNFRLSKYETGGVSTVFFVNFEFDL